ncbi:hypothetical protein F6X56_01355 (plasmid) [Rhodococcus erythropolis]|uniref:hypothetical protein n=1 Tax=Rhodococcus TaxID=1827 RepID=UPI001244EBA0|nr:MULTISPECIES: hypothetical protein [Rhodococcus]MCJ0949919.1 hypothetical protein [Rhodococcus sp. ARC_M8]QEX08421.1 hypothetical protein F6X56_01355 [Rhodococcus erythropolis]
MPLTKKYSQTYNDALIALATVTQRPANVVNVAGDYAIRVDLEYNRYLLATNTTRGLSDEPDTSGSWTDRIFHTDIAKVQDALLGEATASWLIDAFDTAFAHLDTDGNSIVTDADFGAIGFTGTPTSADVKDRIT